MKLYIRAVRYAGQSYSTYDGMTLEAVTQLMTDLGYTDIEQLTEQDFLANMPQS